LERDADIRSADLNAAWEYVQGRPCLVVGPSFPQICRSPRCSRFIAIYQCAVMHG